MKLESLKLDKFKNNGLEREQMFSLKGGLNDANDSGNTVTPAGHNCDIDPISGQHYGYDYGYDVIRDNAVTYHNRTNKKIIDQCIGA